MQNPPFYLQVGDVAIDYVSNDDTDEWILIKSFSMKNSLYIHIEIVENIVNSLVFWHFNFMKILGYFHFLLLLLL